MNLEILKTMIGKATKIKKKDGFGLRGVIIAITGNTVSYETQQRVGYFESEEIVDIVERPRLSYEEQCSCKGHVWIRSTACQVCPFCGCGAK